MNKWTTLADSLAQDWSKMSATQKDWFFGKFIGLCELETDFGKPSVPEAEWSLETIKLVIEKAKQIK